LQRFATLRTGLFEFVFGKVLFGVATVWLGGLILLGGGGLLFKIQWAEPLALAVLIGSYGFFAAGLLATLAAIAGTERRADAMNTSIVMIIAMAGGGFFPAEQLPAFIRENISVWLPNYWLIESIRGLQNASPVNWPIVSLQLGVLGLVFIAVAACLFHRQLSKGSAV
jgi:ABC-type multidrug transport system permease subunit